MVNINVGINVQVAGGPQLSSSKPIEADAYDLIQATVTAGKTIDVEIQPATDVTKVSLLAIKSNWYGADLKYGTADPPDIELNQSQLYLGAAVGKLETNVTKLKFKNETTGNNAKDAMLEIMVARTAVVPANGGGNGGGNGG